MPDHPFGSNPFQPLTVVQAVLCQRGLADEDARALIKKCVSADLVPWRRRALKRDGGNPGNPVWEDPPRGGFDPTAGDELDYARSLIKSGPRGGIIFSCFPGDADEQAEIETDNTVTRDDYFKVSFAVQDYEIHVDICAILALAEFPKNTKTNTQNEKGFARVQAAFDALDPAQKDLLGTHGGKANVAGIIQRNYLPDLSYETIRKYLAKVTR